MSHPLPFKSILLNVFSVFVLLVAVASSGSTTIQAQGDPGSGPEPWATQPSAESPQSPRPTALPPSDGGVGPSSEPRVATLGIQPSMPPQRPLSPQAAWPDNWYTIAGSVFLPANSGYSYQYGNSGCLKSNSPGYWRASVNLPDGSVAKYLYINYKNDMYSNNSTAYLTKYKYNGDYNDLVSVNSRNYTTTGVTGYFLDLSGEFTETIDNLQYSYTFIWSGSTTQRLCSVRVGYYPPSIFGVALPLVTKQ